MAEDTSGMENLANYIKAAQRGDVEAEHAAAEAEGWTNEEGGWRRKSEVEDNTPKDREQQ